MTTANWNLPPGVTPRMIEERFGEHGHDYNCPAYGTEFDAEPVECDCDELARDILADAADREYDRRREAELFGE